MAFIKSLKWGRRTQYRDRDTRRSDRNAYRLQQLVGRKQTLLKFAKQTTKRGEKGIETVSQKYFEVQDSQCFRNISNNWHGG